eukprot:3100502-Amphidinium_carterae.1
MANGPTLGHIAAPILHRRVPSDDFRSEPRLMPSVRSDSPCKIPAKMHDASTIDEATFAAMLPAKLQGRGGWTLLS